MPTQITLLTELSRDRLLELRDEIDALLAPRSGSSDGTSTLTADAEANGTVEELATRLRVRLNADLERLVRYLVDHYGDRSFVWEEVAAGMREKIGTVKSWHRSLSKPLNRLARQFPAAPPFLRSSWDGSRNHYTVNRQWKEAIKKTWA